MIQTIIIPSAAFLFEQASPKAANIHNRWLSSRRLRSLRFQKNGNIVLEEGEHEQAVHEPLMFALFEDASFGYGGTAGSVRFALFTSGYGCSPPSATLDRNDNSLKMCLLCTCESSVK